MKIVNIITFIIVYCYFSIPIYSYAADKSDFTDKINIKNFIKVDNNYYRGANPKEEEYAKLKALGIKSVIDLRLIGERKSKKLQHLLEINNLKFYSIPMNPFHSPTKKQLQEFLSIINNDDNLPVFVHCTHGQDRTGIMSAIYRVIKYDWSFNKAYKEMLHDGYHPHLYGKQKYFLKKFTDKNNQ